MCIWSLGTLNWWIFLSFSCKERVYVLHEFQKRVYILHEFQKQKLFVTQELNLWSVRLDTKTMFLIREWERFQFAIDYQHHQVDSVLQFKLVFIYLPMNLPTIQHKKILERTIPDALKLSIARKIENNLFSKVCQLYLVKPVTALTLVLDVCRFHSWLV